MKWNWTLSIPIEIGGSIVNYSFCTQQGDIDFGITFIPSTDNNSDKDDGNSSSKDKTEAAEVLGEHRVPSEVEPISGVFRSPHEGTVVFYWDNSFSWITPKKLTYCIEVKQVCSHLRYSRSFSHASLACCSEFSDVNMKMMFGLGSPPSRWRIRHARARRGRS